MLDTPTPEDPDDPNSRRITDRLAAERRRRDDRLAGERRRQEELPDRVDILERRLQGMESAAQNIRSSLDARQEDADAKEPIRPWHWPDLDEDTAAQKFDELNDWVTNVLLDRYAEIRDVLHDCWERHPEAWDVLTAAWLTWLMAYRHPARTPALIAEWQATHRTNLETQLKRAMPGCRAGRCERAPVVA